MAKQISDDQLKRQLELKLKKLTEDFEAETLWIKTAIANLEKPGKLNYDENKKSYPAKITVIEPSRVIEPITTMEKIVNILINKNEPLSSSELMQLMNDTYAREKKYDKNGFSGLLSQVYRKPRSPFTKIDVPGGGVRFRNVYVLKAWLVGNKLTKEYQNKLILKAGLNEPLFEK